MTNLGLGYGAHCRICGRPVEQREWKSGNDDLPTYYCRWHPEIKSENTADTSE